MAAFASTMSGDTSNSRQKSCRSCVQAKRRCDRQLPICSRCVDKKLTCIYSNNRKPMQSDRRGLDPSSSSLEGLAFDNPAYLSFETDPLLDINYSEMLPMIVEVDHLTHTTELMEGQTNPATRDDIPLDPLLGLMDNSVDQSQDQWLVHFEEQPVVERPNSPAEGEIFKTYKNMTSCCDGIKPWHMYDPKTPLHYLITRLKHFTNDIATQSSAPFLHRYLYKDHTPPCVVTCFATNVLYTNRTKANTSMVIRALHNNVQELVDTEARRITTTPLEKLARAQSLFLYQIIRLLDGDIILRTQGEKDIPLLRTWLGDLLRLRENLGDLARSSDSVVRRQPPEEWERWIFAESVRRTITIAYSFIALYGLIKGEDNDEDLDIWSYAHRWTLSKHLWLADSSFEFTRVWKEKPQFVITNYSLEHFVECGRGEDVDEFTEILLSAYMGVDEMKEFVSASTTKR